MRVLWRNREGIVIARTADLVKHPDYGQGVVVSSSIPFDGADGFCVVSFFEGGYVAFSESAARTELSFKWSQKFLSWVASWLTRKSASFLVWTSRHYRGR